MATTPEGKVKTAIKAFLRRKGVWFFCPVSNGMGVHGIPDFVCCWAGRFVGVEAKAPGKRESLSEKQKFQREAILAAGGLYFVVDSVSPLAGLFDGLEEADGKYRGA